MRQYALHGVHVHVHVHLGARASLRRNTITVLRKEADGKGVGKERRSQCAWMEMESGTTKCRSRKPSAPTCRHKSLPRAYKRSHLLKRNGFASVLRLSPHALLSCNSDAQRINILCHGIQRTSQHRNRYHVVCMIFICRHSDFCSVILILIQDRSDECMRLIMKHGT